MTCACRNGRTLQPLILALLVAGPLALRGADTSRALEMARLLNEAFVGVAEKVSPAVVVIDIAQREEATDGGMPPSFFKLLPDEWRERLKEEQEQRKQQRRQRQDEGPEFDGQGSGMIISKEGDILTNNHVVEGAEKLRVRLKDGRQFEVEVKGTDPDADLAVIRIKNAPKDLPLVTFGDSEKVRVGEFSIAIGAPFRLDYSVSFGHISAKGRSEVIGGMFDQDFLQTDANINPGNSGGPLVDIEGHVIGINSMIRGMNSGIGFAVPSNLAREIATRLIEDGKFVRSWLGLGIGVLRDDQSVRKLVPDLRDGVVVTSILRDGPSSNAEPELLPSDVITAVDGKAVATPAELKAVVSRKRPGSTVVLDVRRMSSSMKVRVSPGPLPSAEDRFTMASRRGSHESRRDIHGLSVSELSPDEARKFDVESGVRVTEVVPDSIAAEQDIRRGDVISEVNHESVESRKQFEALLKEANPAKGILLHVYRDGEESFRVLKQRKQ